jgi:DNA ligase-4
VWNKAAPPRIIELTPTAEIPDVYVNPYDCCIVLEIRAAEVVPSEKYRLGYTLRHPRVEKIRHDKVGYFFFSLAFFFKQKKTKKHFS